MKKIIGTAIVLLALLISGVYYAWGQEWGLKKIVLQENVAADLNKEKQIKIKVEEIDLKLPEGEYFSPAFYMGNEIYGSVNMGFNTPQHYEKFPVGGIFKQYLYKLKSDNTLKETSKKVFSHVYYSNMIGYEISFSGIETGKLYAIDYTKEDEPEELKELDNILKVKGRLGNNTFISENAVNKDETYLVITTNIPYRGWALYFYNQQNKKFYTRAGNVVNQESVVYMDALKAFIRVEQDFKCYKVVFKDNEYDFVEFLDLKPYVNNSIDTNSEERTIFVPVNDEEILIERQILFRDDKYFSFHPIYETKSLSIFNFKTNQFQELFKTKEQQHIYVNYGGNVEAFGGKLIIVDEFENDNGYILPKERFFKTIVDGQLNTVYKEDISREGRTLNPCIRAIISEDGKEIFLEKPITDMGSSFEISKGAIYKRYIIE